MAATNVMRENSMCWCAVCVWLCEHKWKSPVVRRHFGCTEHSWNDNQKFECNRRRCLRYIEMLPVSAHCTQELPRALWTSDRLIWYCLVRWNVTVRMLRPFKLALATAFHTHTHVSQLAHDRRNWMCFQNKSSSPWLWPYVAAPFLLAITECNDVWHSKETQNLTTEVKWMATKTPFHCVLYENSISEVPSSPQSSPEPKWMRHRLVHYTSLVSSRFVVSFEGIFSYAFLCCGWPCTSRTCNARSLAKCKEYVTSGFLSFSFSILVLRRRLSLGAHWVHRRGHVRVSAETCSVGIFVVVQLTRCREYLVGEWHALMFEDDELISWKSEGWTSRVSSMCVCHSFLSFKWFESILFCR